MDWWKKYGKKMDFFKLAESRGVKVAALETLPRLSPEEDFYWSAYNLLSDAGYSDISQYCRDEDLDGSERRDLLQVVSALKNYQWSISNADS